MLSKQSLHFSEAMAVSSCPLKMSISYGKREGSVSFVAKIAQYGTGTRRTNRGPKKCFIQFRFPRFLSPSNESNKTMIVFFLE